MPLTLIASRNRNNDQPLVFDDVPIDTQSIMVDCLSVLSRYQRSAGWLYPVRKATDISYERGNGRLLLFGKTRCIFPDFPPPYFLEFFPRRGVGVYIVSFYSGNPEVTPDRSRGVPVPGTPYRVRYNSQSRDGTVEKSLDSQTWVPINDGSGIDSGYLSVDNFIYVKIKGVAVFYKTFVANGGWIVISESEWLSVSGSQLSVAL